MLLGILYQFLLMSLLIWNIVISWIFWMIYQIMDLIDSLFMVQFLLLLSKWSHALFLKNLVKMEDTTICLEMIQPPLIQVIKNLKTHMDLISPSLLLISSINNTYIHSFFILSQLLYMVPVSILKLSMFLIKLTIFLFFQRGRFLQT